LKRGLVAALVLLAACSGGNGSSSSNTRTLTVFAASSLTGAFTQIGKQFDAAHPGVNVTFSFGPSDQLASQIKSEGTADVFASASETYLDQVASSPGVADRLDFASNHLVIITPPSNPAKIDRIQDLANPGVQLEIAAAGVPVGDYARQALKTAGVSSGALANVVSNAQDDASLVQAITTGSADAAIVYTSDVTKAIAPSVHVVQIPSVDNVTAVYPAAAIQGSPNIGLAQQFVNYLDSNPGKATLTSFGFLPPPTH